MKFKIICVVLSLMFVGCATKASVSSFPRTNSMVNFDEISKRNLDPDDPAWNLKGRSEYMVYVKSEDEKLLFDLLVAAMSNEGYSVNYAEIKHKAIIGERGIQMNEWNSVSGIYYREMPDWYQVYIRVDITQDITGGWKENRAKKIADEICSTSKKCK